MKPILRQGYLADAHDLDSRSKFGWIFRFRESAEFLRHYEAVMGTLSGGIGNGSKWLLDKIVGVIAATGINPNLLTFLGLVVNFVAAAFFAIGSFFTGALIIFFAGFLDILDGQVARRQNRVTAFGAFYDSTLDRYADMALYMGLLVYYSVTARPPYFLLAPVPPAGPLPSRSPPPLPTSPMPISHPCF